MCGIAGIYNLNNTKVSQKVLKAMSLAIKHRGPDGEGIHIDEHIGIANRRLAIIDPTKAGDQPISTKDRKYWITFNGEIFNYKEIRQELVKKGYVFQSHTDTETILYGFVEYGPTIFKKLIGQFALCIWDKLNDRFIFARDQLGVNQLYYTCVGNSVLFASEVKGILASGMVERTLEPEALHHYLSVYSIPAPLTMIKGVKSLLPGTYAVVDRKGMKFKTFWTLPNFTWKDNKKSEEELKYELKTNLLSAVKSASVSDVPVAAFLSGGIDSSTVVALLAQQSTKPVHTYSLWTDAGDAFDERPYAKLVAEKYGTKHTEITVSEKQMANELLKIIYYFDQPTGGSMENYFVSKLAVKDVKVALSGLGGDELFAGYHSYIYASQKSAELYRLIPLSLRNSGVTLLNRLPISSDIKKTVRVGHEMLSLPQEINQRLYLHYAFSEVEKKTLYSGEFSQQMNSFNTDGFFRELMTDYQSEHPVDQLSYLDLLSYTRDDLLVGMNMMTMANSLEGRVPLLDPRLVAFAASIPPEYKYRNGVTKYLLREVVKEWLPDEVINHKKTGFSMPRIKYMKGILAPYIKQILSYESVARRGIFNPDVVQKELQVFFSDTSQKKLWSEHLRIWSLFILEIWCRLYLDKPVIVEPAESLKDIC